MRTRTLATGLGAAVLLACLTPPPIAQAADDAAALASRMAKLERALDNRGLLDLLQQVERLQEDVRRLRGQVEEQTYTIEQLRKTQRDTYVDIDQRLQALGRGGTMIGGDDTGAAAPPLTTFETGDTDEVAGTESPSSLQLEIEREYDEPIADEPLDDDAVRADTLEDLVPRPTAGPSGPVADNEASEAGYRDAFSLLKAGRYDESIEAFNQFLTQFPNSQYADNAQYWLGETYYVKREFEPALAEYTKLVQMYPESKKQSHAMLKIGYSYHELGQPDQARAVLEDLRSRFPGTTAARLAEERIQILGRGR